MTNEAKILTGIVIVTILLVVGAVIFLSQPEKPVVVDPQVLVKDDSLKMSTPSAKLTVVEFGDLQCPACKMAHPGLKQALADYPGQVNFVFRHFPLAQHKNAIIAAKAVEAANIQGKAFEMIDKLYTNQEEWAESDNPVEIYKKYAAEIGINPDQMASDMDKPEIADKISKDQADGTATGVNSTPTLYFNNELYKSGIGYNDFKTAIEAKLK